MSVSVQKRGNRHLLRVVHALLPRPFFFTFDEAAPARADSDQLHALLDRGIVPHELLAGAGEPKVDDPLLIEIVRDYTQHAPLTDSDDELLRVIIA